MDIAALSMVMSQQSAGLQASVAITKLAMETTTDSMAQFMQDMTKSMELSVNPSIGANMDIRI